MNKSDGITSDSSESESTIILAINWLYASVRLGVVAGAKRRFAASFLQLLQSFCSAFRLKLAARSLSTGLKKPRGWWEKLVYTSMNKNKQAILQWSVSRFILD